MPRKNFKLPFLPRWVNTEKCGFEGTGDRAKILRQENIKQLIYLII